MSSAEYNITHIFYIFLNFLFLNIFRISPGLPNVTDQSCDIIYDDSSIYNL